MAADPEPEVSVIIPAKNGGALFGKVLEKIFVQKVPFPFEVLVVDSGSREEDLRMIRSHPVRLHQIPAREFNHGLTRDLGASIALGKYLVFLNQDAVPCNEHWLARVVEPLQASDEFAAVQGGQREIDDGPRFFWHSMGARFYFTRESEGWIKRYHGIGFSTVNAAIRRSAWEACPFGETVMMEDKKWQRAATERGLKIADRPDATVYHTHVYDFRGLSRRCQQEGFGWRLVGERYRLWDMIRDTASWPKYRELLRGLRARQVRTLAEFLFPFLRPWLVFKGGRLNRRFTS